MKPEQAYWAVVRECRHAFHGRTIAEAAAMMDARRSRANERRDDLVFHFDPFDIACGLARHKLDEDEYAQAYPEIWNKYFQPHEQLVHA